jgi:hypothetical protein
MGRGSGKGSGGRRGPMAPPALLAVRGPWRKTVSGQDESEILPSHFEAGFCDAKRANAAHQKPCLASSFEIDFCDAGRPNSTGFARRRKTYPFRYRAAARSGNLISYICLPLASLGKAGTAFRRIAVRNPVRLRVSSPIVALIGTDTVPSLGRICANIVFFINGKTAGALLAAKRGMSSTSGLRTARSVQSAATHVPVPIDGRAAGALRAAKRGMSNTAGKAASVLRAAKRGMSSTAGRKIARNARLAEPHVPVLDQCRPATKMRHFLCSCSQPATMGPIPSRS